MPKTLRMAAADISNALKAFDHHQRHLDMAEPGKNSARTVLWDHNRSKQKVLIGSRVRGWHLPREATR